MPIFDYPIGKLREYRPPLTRQPDFGEFWTRTLAEASRIPLEPELQPSDYPVNGLRVFRATYSGWAGARIAGWYLVPDGPGPYPAIAFYHGYSGSAGPPYDYLGWASQGYAVLATDVRGQNGESDDPADYPGGHYQGWMTLGVLDPSRYYYRGAFVDCVRALDFLAARPEVDPERLGVSGISQGGGLSLAVAALDRRPKLAMADVPFLCHYRRAVEVTDQRPYLELIEYCRSHPGREDRVFRTLSYFDVMNLAPEVACPTLVSVGLLDMVCPPSTVFATYNHLAPSASPKDLKVYPFGVHAVYPDQWEEKLRWARRHLRG